MSAVKETFLVCDQCGETFGVDNRNDTAARHRQEAKSLGWKYRNGKDYCLDCWNTRKEKAQ